MRRIPKAQKCEAVNPFSGIVYYADCGKKLYINRGKNISKSQEHIQQIDMYYRFNIAVSTAIAEDKKYGRSEKAE